jgi:aminoglycoside phosphotransferase (APT) family kinase protein
MTDRRYPIIPFSTEDIIRFLESKKILTVELIESGKSHTNYKIVISSGKCFVVRYYSRTTPEKENNVLNLVKNLVPVPDILYQNEKLAIYSYLKGRMLHEIPEFTRQAAKALVQISSIRFKSQGLINTDGNITPWELTEYKNFVRDMFDNKMVSALLGTDKIERIKKILKRESLILNEIYSECRLVHGDYNPTNILIQNGEVSGILDWEFSHSGSPYMDIGNLLRNTDEKYHKDIFEGLNDGGMNLPHDWRERAMLIDISSQVEFLTSNRSDDFKRKCMERIDRFLLHFENI